MDKDLWFFHFACHLMLTNMDMNFRGHIFNGFQVIGRTRFYDRQSSKGNN